VPQVTVDNAAFASRLQPGDVLTVLYPFPMTVTSVAVADDGTETLGIDAYAFDGDLAAGATIATTDNRVRFPLAAAIPANQQILSIAVQGFTSADAISLARRDGAFQSGSAAIATVSPAGSVVYLDDNFLPYPGRHRITMEGA
jgi:hypothetical protein